MTRACRATAWTACSPRAACRGATSSPTAAPSPRCSGWARPPLPASPRRSRRAHSSKPVVWLAQGLCTGCTESMAQTAYPDVPALVLELLSVDYWETLMAASGEAAENAKARHDRARAATSLVVEGAMMRGFDGNACRIAGKTGLEHLREAVDERRGDHRRRQLRGGRRLAAGGAVAAESDGVGVKDVPRAHERQADHQPPHLPGEPRVGRRGRGRPPPARQAPRARRRRAARRLIYGATIHDNCPRRGHFENGEFVEDVRHAGRGARLVPVQARLQGTADAARTARWCAGTARRAGASRRAAPASAAPTPTGSPPTRRSCSACRTSWGCARDDRRRGRRGRPRGPRRARRRASDDRPHGPRRAARGSPEANETSVHEEGDSDA